MWESDLCAIDETIPSSFDYGQDIIHPWRTVGDELINTGETLLVFVNMKTNRPCMPSQEFIDKLKPFFQ